MDRILSLQFFTRFLVIFKLVATFNPHGLKVHCPVGSSASANLHPIVLEAQMHQSRCKQAICMSEESSTSAERVEELKMQAEKAALKAEKAALELEKLELQAKQLRPENEDIKHRGTNEALGDEGRDADQAQPDESLRVPGATWTFEGNSSLKLHRVITEDDPTYKTSTTNLFLRTRERYLGTRFDGVYEGSFRLQFTLPGQDDKPKVVELLQSSEGNPSFGAVLVKSMRCLIMIKRLSDLPIKDKVIDSMPFSKTGGTLSSTDVEGRSPKGDMAGSTSEGSATESVFPSSTNLVVEELENELRYSDAQLSPMENKISNFIANLLEPVISRLDTEASIGLYKKVETAADYIEEIGNNFGLEEGDIIRAMSVPRLDQENVPWWFIPTPLETEGDMCFLDGKGREQYQAALLTNIAVNGWESELVLLIERPEQAEKSEMKNEMEG
mmetsp:Transcript_56179/g.98088  ORF Transcript_56179/g.98088 Transcript_56179/m.98088 type:complete len:443 (+) Transcript_56179:134-1462(+)